MCCCVSLPSLLLFGRDSLEWKDTITPGSSLQRFSNTMMLFSLMTAFVGIFTSPKMTNAEESIVSNSVPLAAAPPKLLRVGVVASNLRVVTSQGFQARFQFLRRNVHYHVYQDVNFTIQHLHGSKTDALFLGDGVKCADFDVFIHKDRPWFAALARCENASHIYDPDDHGFNFKDYYNPVSWRTKDNVNHRDKFYAETRFSFAAVEKMCKSKRCVRIPLAIPLPCLINGTSHSANAVGIIGHSYAVQYGNITSVLHAHNYTVLHERNFAKKPCHFFQRIAVGIAWSPFLSEPKVAMNKTAYEASWEYYNYMTKAAERFTNSIEFNIPTIGYSNYDSYQYYGDDFLCNTTDCVLGLLKRIKNNEMEAQFSALRERVSVDLNPTTNAKIWMQLLIDAVHDKNPQMFR